MLNWFCSALLVWFYGLVAVFVAWRFSISIYFEILGDDFTIDKYATPLAESFLPFIFLFSLITIWHLFDMSERGRGKLRWNLPFATYRHMMIVLLVTGPILIMAAPKGIGLFSCLPSHSGEFGFHMNLNCPPPSTADMLFGLACIPALIALCISKAISAVVSWFGAFRAEEA
ncbi:MAG: hypothetical protein AAF697_13580 [Pseudomonadota bacterium]